MGPFGRISEEYKEMLIQNLNRYQVISVREEKSQEAVFQLINKRVPIMPDPVLLLTSEEWDRLIDDVPYSPKKDYILLYTLYDDDNLDKLAKKISRYFKMPIIITKYGNGSRFFSYMGYKKETSCGPCEFLQLLKHARFVLSASFHGTVFSIIYQKPFFAYHGAADARIATLLCKTNLQDRSVTLADIDQKLESAFLIDFDHANRTILEERKNAIQFLKGSIGL